MNTKNDDHAFDVFRNEGTIRLTEDGGVLKDVVKEGKGSRPSHGSACDVHYVGRLKDGTVFDSSRDRKKPFRFVLGGGSVIQGFDIAVASMKSLERSKVVMTPKYAYGSEGSKPHIPPDATLVYDLELMCWYSNPKSCPGVKSDPIPETIKMKQKKAMQRRIERLDALTAEEERIKRNFALYETSRGPQIGDLLAHATATKEIGNRHFKGGAFVEAIASYEAAVKELESVRARVSTLKPTRRIVESKSEDADPLTEEEKAIATADDVISLTVEEATLTKDVKSRLARLEGTAISGATAAKIDSARADRIILRRMTLSLREEAAKRARELEVVLRTNCSAALFRTGNFEASEASASSALLVDPFCSKALYRRSLAREKLETSPSNVNGSLDDMAVAMAFAQSDKKRASLRYSLFEMCLRCSDKFLDSFGCTIETSSGGVRGRTCVAKKRFAPGEVLWEEKSLVMCRCGEVNAEVLHRDALKEFLGQHRTSTAVATFAKKIGRMLAMLPLRSFVERRSIELRRQKKKKKKKSTATSSSEAAEWVALQLGTENALKNKLKPSVVQRTIWEMDELSKSMLVSLFEPLDLSSVMHLLLETIYLNSHDLSIGGFALAHHASNINHSCWPNVDVVCIDPSMGAVVRAVREISPGDEILMSYRNPFEIKVDRIPPLYHQFRFVCKCPRCAGDTYEGRTPALVEIDEAPYAAKGSEEDLVAHDQLFRERMERIRWECDRCVARGKELEGHREALKAIAAWLRDAKNFYATHNPQRFLALRVAANHAFMLARIDEGLGYIRQCDEIYARVHPSHWPWGYESLSLPRIVALRVLGGKDNILEAERCERRLGHLDSVHASSRALWSRCGEEEGELWGDEVRVMLKSSPDAKLPDALRERLQRSTEMHSRFLASRKRALDAQHGNGGS